MDYTALVGDENTLGSIKRAINWSRVDSVSILDEAQKWIYARLRVREMKSRADIAISLDATTAALPTGYLDPIVMKIPGVVTIRSTDDDRFQRLLPWDTTAVLQPGPPTRFAVFDEVFNFNTKADQAYTAKLLHYKQPTALSPTTLTNFLTNRYPTLLRRACLMFAAEEMKNRTIWNENEERCLEMIEAAKRESDLQYRGMEADFNWQEEGEDYC